MAEYALENIRQELSRGNMAAVQDILNDVDTQDLSNVFSMAAILGYDDVVRVFLDWPDAILDQVHPHAWRMLFSRNVISADDMRRVAPRLSDQARTNAFEGAVQAQRLDILDILHEQGVNISYQRLNELLGESIAEGRADEAIYLIEHGANPATLSERNLLRIAQMGHVELARDAYKTANLRPIELQRAVEYAVLRRHLGIIPVLMQRGATIPSHYYGLVGTQPFNLVEAIVRNANRRVLNRYLVSATEHNRPDVVRLVLSLGAEPSYSNSQPIRNAVLHHNFQILDLFLQAGVSAERIYEFVQQAPPHTQAHFQTLIRFRENLPDSIPLPNFPVWGPNFARGAVTVTQAISLARAGGASVIGHVALVNILEFSGSEWFLTREV